MAYKAVSTSVSHIAHAGLGYTVDWQKKRHSKANGWYIPKSDTVAEEINGVKLGGYNESHDSSRSTYTRNRDMGSGSASTGGGSTNNTNDTSGRVWPDAETIKNAKYYEGQDPSKMTDEKLRDYRNRKVMEDYYNRNNPSKYDTAIDIAKSSQQFIRDGSSYIKNVIPDQPRKRLDLSNMSDDELRTQVNRANLERQYNDYFNPPTVNKGKEYVDNFSNWAGLALTAGTLGLEVVKTIKSFK